MKVGDTGVVFSKELSVKFVRMAELKKERQKIYDEQDNTGGNRTELMAIKDNMRAKIDKFYNKEDMIPKAIRDAEKAFQTTSGTYKLEQEFVRRVSFLKDSVPCIKKYEEADAKLKAMMSHKKNAGTDLPKVKEEMKKLQE